MCVCGVCVVCVCGVWCVWVVCVGGGSSVVVGSEYSKTENTRWRKKEFLKFIIV